MEIYIVRHGETIWNSNHLLQGHADIELNENGRRLAAITGKKLEGTAFDVIYSSPLIRAYETACLIRGYQNIPIIRDERLKELCFGEYEGKDVDELLHNESDPFHYFFTKPELFEPASGGETLDELRERTADFMRNVVEPNEKKWNRIMIAGHGAMNKAIMCHIYKHPNSMFWSNGLQSNCGVIIVELTNGHYNVIDEKRVYY